MHEDHEENDSSTLCESENIDRSQWRYSEQYVHIDQSRNSRKKRITQQFDSGHHKRSLGEKWRATQTVSQKVADFKLTNHWN